MVDEGRGPLSVGEMYTDFAHGVGVAEYRLQSGVLWPSVYTHQEALGTAGYRSQ